MRNKKPPFTITNAIISDVADIAELVGKLSGANQLLPTRRCDEQTASAPSTAP